MDSGKEEIYWCYTSTDVIKIYNCFLHSVLNDCPDYICYVTCPSIHQLIPWQCVIYPHTHDTKTLALRLMEGYYFGITNSNSLVEWYDSTEHMHGKTNLCQVP
eukprot:10814582-Ditylum_brightwellii.AAC.1